MESPITQDERSGTYVMFDHSCPYGTNGLNSVPRWVFLTLAIAVTFAAGCRRHEPIGRAAAEPIGTDAYGDALPMHALARLGTVRFLPATEAWAVAVSPDGKTVATGTAMLGGIIGEVELWDAETGRKTGSLARGAANIVGLAWSPEATRLAVSADDRIDIWDVASSERDGTLEVPEDAMKPSFWCLRWSHNGKRLAARCSAATHGDHTSASIVCIWDATSHCLVSTFPVDAELKGLDITADGATVAVAGERFLDILDVQTLQPRFARPDIDYTISSIAFSPDGENLAGGIHVGDEESWIMVWNASTGDDVRRLGPFSGTTKELVYASDGAVLASHQQPRQSADVVRLWDVASQALRAEFQTHGHWCISLSRDGKTLATAGPRVRIWDVETGNLRQNYPAHMRWPKLVAFAGENQLVTQGSSDDTVRHWRLSDGEHLRSISISGCFAFGFGGRIAVAVEPDGSISLRSTDSGARAGTLAVHFTNPSDPAVRTGALSPAGDHLATIHDDGKVRLWDVNRKTLLCVIQPDPCFPEAGDILAHFHSIAFSPDGKALGWCSAGHDVELWDVEQNRRLGCVPDSAHMFCGPFALAPDGRTIAVPGVDREAAWEAYQSDEDTDTTVVRRWDYRKQREVWTSQHVGIISAMACSPDGRLVATAGLGDKEPIRVWSAATGKLLSELRGHMHQIRGLYFAPDSSLLVSASMDMTLLVWEVQRSGKIVRAER